MTRRICNFLLKTLSIFALMLCSFNASAQAIYSIKLKLLDDKTSEPVAFATLSVTVQGAKEPVKYVLTDADGVGTLAKLTKGTYTVKADLMGYESFSKLVTLEKNIDLGEVRMREDAEVLDAAAVTAVGNPILVKKDTIEYTASSFKTSDNDMLEALLKKLPGVEVEADGSITANGETIKKITIDGKTFFLDDPQLASKNIPAKLIEKVKVVEKKSDQAKFTGIDDGEEEMVIDLSLKPGMMQGWFGNLMGGGGHDVPGAGSDMNDWRYQGAAMVGKFTENSQVSFIFNANNTNNRGFNDVAGSMMQTMRGARGMGRSMGGWRNNGIANTWMGGANGAFTLFDGDMDLSGNYLYNGSDRFVEEESSKITYLEDGSRLLNNQKGTNHTFSQGHRFGVRLEHEFSENTSILFEPQFNFGSGSYSEYSDFQTYTERDSRRDSTNRGYTNNTGDNRNWNTSGFFLFRQRLGKPGRTMSVNFRYHFSNNELLGFNQSMTEVKSDEGNWSQDPVNQLVDQDSRGASLSGRFVYTEPITQHFFFEANYNYGWSRNTSTKKTFNSGTNETLNGLLVYDPSGAVEDSRYSNNILNRSVTQRAGFNFSYQKDKIRAQLGASVNPTNTYNETTGYEKPYENTVINWSPQANFNYDISENSNVRLFYFGWSNQPSTSQLMPVPDNSDPLNVSLGNPNLDPYFTHNLRGHYRFTNKKTFTSLNANFGARLVENDITNAQWYDPAGVQYSIPVNGPASGNVDGRLMVNSPFGKSGFSIFSMTYARYNRSTSYIGTGALDSSAYYDAENASFDYGLFQKDFPDLDASDKFITNNTQTVSFTQRLRLTYRNDIVEVTVGGRTRMNKSWYTMENSQMSATWNNKVDMSMNWTIPGGLNFITDLDYNWYMGYTTPQEDEFILNAEITKLVFKKKCTLALKAYDILGQSKNLSVSDSANYHQEVRNNTLGRYIIVSMTYRFGNFGGNRGGMPGGPMGPHRR